MFRVGLCLTVVVSFTFHLYAQDSFQEMEWGKVDPGDLAMTIYPQDSLAQAVVLGDEGYASIGYDTDQSYQYTLRRHRRVKILKEVAMEEYGDVIIYYYHDKRLDRLRNIKAQTIAPDGTITRVGKSEIYYEELNEYWSKATFSFPKVVVGSVLEYRYVHLSKRILIPEEWSFRESIPVRSSYYQFTCNVPMVYTYLLQGADYMYHKNLGDNKELFTLGETEIHVDGPRIWMKNGAAVTEEPFMTTAEDYYIKVRFQATESLSGTGRMRSYYSTWEEACEDLLDRDDLGGAFTRKRWYDKLLEAAQAAIPQGLSERERVYQISRFITEQIKWSGRRGIRTDITLNQAFERHEADLPEIQYAGLVLLREFGIPADPIILSTRDNGAMIRQYPFLDQFNYVVLLAEVEGRQQLLDFSDPLLKPGLVQLQALNSEGFLLNEDTPQWINIALPTMSDVLVWRGEITTDGSLTGELTCTWSALRALRERRQLEEETVGDLWRERLPEGGTFTEGSVEHLDDVRQRLKIKGQFAVSEAGFVNGDYMYVSPVIYASIDENPFSLDQRDYPVNFFYPFSEKSVYVYELPEGYALDFLPASVSVELPDGGAILDYQCEERDGKVGVIVELRVQKTLFLPAEYTALRELFEQLEEKMQEQLVLRKLD